jgi:hypothetical protein
VVADVPLVVVEVEVEVEVDGEGAVVGTEAATFTACALPAMAEPRPTAVVVGVEAVVDVEDGSVVVVGVEAVVDVEDGSVVVVVAEDASVAPAAPDPVGLPVVGQSPVPETVLVALATAGAFGSGAVAQTTFVHTPSTS